MSNTRANTSGYTLSSAMHIAGGPWLTVGLCCVLLLGAYLRLRGLTFQSFWDDELFSAAVSDPHNSLTEVLRRVAGDVHPPLFQVLLWLWFKVFGFSELSGRLFPALFGVLALPVIYRLGCEVRNRETGLVAALLCAVNIFHLRYSQEMRSYSMLFFFGALSLLFYIRLLRRPGRRDLAAFLAATIALIYTHNFGLFAVMAEALAMLLLLRSRPALRPVALRVGIVLAAAALPLIPLLIRSAILSTFWIPMPSSDFAIDYFIGYFGPRVLAGTAVLAMLYGIGRIDRDAADVAVLRVLLLWLVAVLLLPYIRSMMSVPMLTPRNTIIVLPVVFLLMALGITTVRDGMARALLVFAILAISLLHIFHEPNYYRKVSKPQVREAARALIAAHPDANAVFAPAEVVENFNIYFSLYRAPFRAQPLESLEALRRAGKVPPRIWLVDGRVRLAFDKPIMHDAAFRIVDRKDFMCATLVTMEPTASPAQ